MFEIVAICLFWQQLEAPQPGPVPGPVFGDNWTLFIMTVKMLLALGFVCILAWLTLKHGLPRMAGLQSTQSQLMKVVARFPLDAQKSLYIVEVTGKHLLLGVTAERIEMLTELSSDSVQEALNAAALELAAKPSFTTAAVKEFSKYLRR